MSGVRGGEDKGEGARWRPGAVAAGRPRPRQMRPPNGALDSAVIRAVSGKVRNEEMVTPSGSCPVGSPAAAALSAWVLSSVLFVPAVCG